MISKVASLRFQTKIWARLLTVSPQNHFSSTPPADNNTVKVENLVNQDKQEKDENHQEMAFKFEREWKKVYDERNTSQIAELEKELSPNQKKRIDLLAQALLEMNMFEMRYFSSIIRDKVFKTSGINPLKLNLDWPSIKQTDIGSWPPNNPNYFLQQEAIAKLWPAGPQGFAQLFGGAAFGGSGGAGGAPQQQQAAAAEAPKEEKKADAKPQEKEKFDIELASIDATKKIAIIKEVRELLKLGLKEAKEMVEKAPVTLKKDVKKEEAEQLKEKLSGLGCSINLL